MLLSTPQRRHFARSLLPIVLTLLAAVCAHAQERADCRVFHSKLLKSPVRYCVLLPADYSSPDARHTRYPVLYLLHGLGGTQDTVMFGGEWGILQDLRREGKVGEFLVVSPEAWDTFYINSRNGQTRYGDFFLQEFMPFIEHAYRIRASRRDRGITGISMGGYGALRMAFAHPELFGSVSAHSAAMMRHLKDLEAVPSPGNVISEVFTKVFGDSPDQSFWKANSPYVLAHTNAEALAGMKIYFDCGTGDVFARGASELDAVLTAQRIPHEFHLFPGGHDQAYWLTHRVDSFEFHWREFSGSKSLDR